MDEPKVIFSLMPQISVSIWSSHTWRWAHLFRFQQWLGELYELYLEMTIPNLPLFYPKVVRSGLALLSFSIFHVHNAEMYSKPAADTFAWIDIITLTEPRSNMCWTTLDPFSYKMSPCFIVTSGHALPQKLFLRFDERARHIYIHTNIAPTCLLTLWSSRSVAYDIIKQIFEPPALLKRLKLLRHSPAIYTLPFDWLGMPYKASQLDY